MISRKETLAQLQEQTFDLLVIGSGAMREGIALDGATRSLRTALIEKQDFTFGTSSRSTKLIHGGLRYLKQFEVGLVREVGFERAIVHRNVPHLVIPEKMLLPLNEGGQYGRFMTAIGLAVCDLLARVAKSDSRRMLGKKATLEKEPLLDANRLKGGGWNAEYLTDDARLTISLIRTAAEALASCANYVSAESFEKSDNQVTGVIARDGLIDKTFSIRAKQSVNATGPRVDQLREKDGSRSRKGLYLTKWLHLVVDREKLPIRQSIYFDVMDDLMIAVISPGNNSYICTTGNGFDENISHPKTSTADVICLIDTVNAFFSDITLTLADIQSTRAGLRQLIQDEGKPRSELSRKDEIFESPEGLISVAGSKFTDYRKMAERVVNRMIKRLPEHSQECTSASIFLVGGPFQDAAEVETFVEAIAQWLHAFGIANPKLAAILVYRCGRDLNHIQGHAEQHRDHAGEEKLEHTLLRAEICFSVNHEMVQCASDFCVRCTGRL